MSSHYGNGMPPSKHTAASTNLNTHMNDVNDDEEGLDYLLDTDNTFEDTTRNGIHHHTTTTHSQQPASSSTTSFTLPSYTNNANKNIGDTTTTTTTTTTSSTAAITTTDTNTSDPAAVAKEAESLRVSMELEFVQCLANPRYLHFLAQQRYFQDQAFVNYLKYLLYWKKPEYAKFIVYPHALFFLDRLQEESFRKELINASFVELLWRQQFNHWRYYKLHRTAAPPTEETTGDTSIPTPPQPM